jgi:hypothetical protein
MHQTSSRLLRMTDDDRPFTRVCFSKAAAMLARMSSCRALWHWLFVTD